MTRRPSITELRAAWWAYRCLRARAAACAAGHTDVRVAPPTLAATSIRGVDAVLRRTRPTCLEAALVRQRWLRAQGVLSDVVVGVTAPSDGFRAHAWLEDPSGSSTRPNDSAAPKTWHELTRLPA